MFLNDVTFAGFVGRDAEEFTTKGGLKIITLSIGHTEKSKLENREDKTTWLKVKVFGSWAEEASLIKKGDNVFIKGRLETESYKDKAGVEKTMLVATAYALARIERTSKNVLPHQSTLFEPRPTTPKTTTKSYPASSPAPDLGGEDIPF